MICVREPNKNKYQNYGFPNKPDLLPMNFYNKIERN